MSRSDIGCRADSLPGVIPYPMSRPLSSGRAVAVRSLPMPLLWGVLGFSVPIGHSQHNSYSMRSVPRSN
eukprot:1103676-Pyramimonas_sp.AAC.1